MEINLDFAEGIGFYPTNKQECPVCKGTGEGEQAFAKGIGSYPTTCKECNGTGRNFKQ